jgi:hypothetical protein
MAPVGVPDSIVQKINADLRVVLAQPDLVEKFAAIGTYPQPLSPTETAAFIRAEQQLWWPVVREVEGSGSPANHDGHRLGVRGAREPVGNQSLSDILPESVLRFPAANSHIKMVPPTRTTAASMSSRDPRIRAAPLAPLDPGLAQRG